MMGSFEDYLEDRTQRLLGALARKMGVSLEAVDHPDVRAYIKADLDREFANYTFLRSFEETEQ